jgi:hypothetical protein
MSTDSVYPVRVEGTLDTPLSRWLWLVKWLLAIPHYVVVGIFAGGSSGGLVTVLVCVAGVVLLFTGAYPRGIYDFVLGMNRWGLRDVAYAALKTDQYPPFRLDLGGREPEALPGEAPGSAQAAT